MNNRQLNNLANDVREQSYEADSSMKDLVYDPATGEFRQVDRGTQVGDGDVVTEMTNKGFAMEDISEEVRRQGHGNSMKDLVFNPATNEFEQVNHGAHVGNGEVVTEMTKGGFAVEDVSEEVRRQSYESESSMKDLVYDRVTGEFKQVDRGTQVSDGDVVTEMTNKGFALGFNAEEIHNQGQGSSMKDLVFDNESCEFTLVEHGTHVGTGEVVNELTRGGFAII